MELKKSIFLSKTFWLNVLGTSAMVAQILPPKYGVPAMGVLNIANRFVTASGVSLTGN